MRVGVFHWLIFVIECNIYKIFCTVYAEMYNPVQENNQPLPKKGSIPLNAICINRVSTEHLKQY